MSALDYKTTLVEYVFIPRHIRYFQVVRLYTTHEVVMVKKNSLKNGSNVDKIFDMCGYKIQNTKVDSVPILLIQEKPIEKFAIIQSQRNTVNTRGCW